MRNMSAKDAKNHFGELLMEAQKEPVTFGRHGMPVAVMPSFASDQAIAAAKLEWPHSQWVKGGDAFAHGYAQRDFAAFGLGQKLLESLKTFDKMVAG